MHSNLRRKRRRRRLRVEEVDLMEEWKCDFKLEWRDGLFGGYQK